MPTVIAVTNDNTEWYYHQFIQSWSQWCSEFKLQSYQGLVEDQLLDILTTGTDTDWIIFLPVDYPLTQHLPAYVVGVGTIQLPQPVTKRPPRNLLYLDQVIVPTPSIGYQVTHRIPSVSVRVVPPLVQPSTTWSNTRLDRTHRLALLSQLVSSQAIPTNSCIILTTAEQLPSLGNITIDADLSIHWLILVGPNPSHLTQLTEDAMDLGWSPDMYSTVPQESHDKSTALETVLSVCEWICLPSIEPTVNWFLLLQSQYRNIPVICHPDSRYQDYLCVGTSLSPGGNLSEVISSFSTMDPGKRLVSVNSFQALVNSTMTPEVIKSTYREVGCYLERRSQLSRYRNLRVPSLPEHSDEPFDLDSSQDTEETPGLIPWLQRIELPVNGWGVIYDENLTIRSKEVTKQLNLEGVSLGWDSTNQVLYFRRIPEIVQWLTQLETTEVDTLAKLGQQTKLLPEGHHVSLILNDVALPISLTGRYLFTSEGPIYFSEARRCKFNNQWFSYTSNGDTITIQLSESESVTIRCSPNQSIAASIAIV